MLDLKITIEGDKVLIEGLNKFAAELPEAVQKGLAKVGSGSFTAGEFETVIYDSVPYVDVIHEGRGSSAKYGPRRYLTDALEAFNQGARIEKSIADEIEKEIDKAGLT